MCDGCLGFKRDREIERKRKRERERKKCNTITSIESFTGARGFVFIVIVLNNQLMYFCV